MKSKRTEDRPRCFLIEPFGIEVNLTTFFRNQAKVGEVREGDQGFEKCSRNRISHEG